MSNLQVTLPDGQGYQDLQTATQTAVVTSDTSDVFTLVNFFNKYLRFALGVVAMVVVIIAGVKLVVARGEEKDMTSAKNALIGVGVGTVIAIFAYLIVKVIANIY